MGAAADYLREQYTKKQNQIASSGRVAGLTGTSNYSRSSSSSNTATNPLDYATYRYETWRANDKVALNTISRNSSSSSTTSSSGTTSSSNTISSVDTTSDNDATEVAGTSTEISEAADYPSSNTVVSEDVNDVSSNTDMATDFSGGEEITSDYSSESEIVAEPTIETSTEDQTVAVVEEVRRQARLNRLPLPKKFLRRPNNLLVNTFTRLTKEENFGAPPTTTLWLAAMVTIFLSAVKIKVQTLSSTFPPPMKFI